MQDFCEDHARFMQRSCKILAKIMQDSCKDHARFKQRSCKILAKNMQGMFENIARSVKILAWFWQDSCLNLVWFLSWSCKKFLLGMGIGGWWVLVDDVYWGMMGIGGWWVLVDDGYWGMMGIGGTGVFYVALSWIICSGWIYGTRLMNIIIRLRFWREKS